MSDRNASTKLRQEISLLEADRKGEVWTLAELELLAECPEIAAWEMAEALGRTVYAVNTMRQLLDGKAPAERRNKPVKQAPARTWTFIGDDVPEGW